MRQGCMSIGTVNCDSCHNVIPYAERYLLVNEEDGVEVDSGTRSSYCVNCSLEKGYARYREEKGERILTFFAFDLEPETPDEPPAEDAAKEEKPSADDASGASHASPADSGEGHG